MTVERLLREVGSDEIAEWIALRKIENAEAAMRAKMAARRQGR